MPADRHSSPPPRPPRDRHTGPGFGGPRRSFSGGGFGGPGGGFGGPGGGPGGPGGPRDGGPRPPFVPRPPLAAQEPAHSVRLREGDREAEVHGSPVFIRQTLDDLPALFARLRGETPTPPRPQSISMPRPPHAEHVDEHEPFDEPDADDEEPEPPAPTHRRERHAATNGRGSLEDRVFGALKRAEHPLSVAAIRKLVGGDTTGQQIRRILERASDRVVATSERPAAYALR